MRYALLVSAAAATLALSGCAADAAIVVALSVSEGFGRCQSNLL